jgi:hypothetical protein
MAQPALPGTSYPFDGKVLSAYESHQASYHDPGSRVARILTHNNYIAPEAGQSLYEKHGVNTTFQQYGGSDPSFCKLGSAEEIYSKAQFWCIIL